MSGSSIVALALAAAMTAPEAAPPPEIPPPPAQAWPTTPPPVASVPPPAVAPQPVPAATSDGLDPTLRRRGTGMLIGAAILFTAGSAFNITRAFVASGRCQQPGQPLCTGSWFAATTGAWLTNIPAVALAAGGGEVRGRADDSDGARRRKHTARVVGPIVGALGLLTNLSLRLLWIHDYATPRDTQAFDFAKRSDAMFYYGGLQVSSIALGAGLATTLYGHARGPARRVSAAPVIGRDMTGLVLRGRF